jgi:hypothetical protein
MCAISMHPIFVFASFAYQVQIAENTIFLIIEKIFHSGLDGTMILYTILARFVT